MTRPVTINQPDALTSGIDKTDATFGNLGSITFTSTTGGTPPYEYTIDGPAGSFTSQTTYTDPEGGT